MLSAQGARLDSSADLPSFLSIRLTTIHDLVHFDVYNIYKYTYIFYNAKENSNDERYVDKSLAMTSMTTRFIIK